MPQYNILVLGSSFRSCSRFLLVEAANEEHAMVLANEAVKLGEVEPDQYTEEDVTWDQVTLED